jgi:hypothetical protein
VKLISVQRHVQGLTAGIEEAEVAESQNENAGVSVDTVIKGL